MRDLYILKEIPQNTRLWYTFPHISTQQLLATQTKKIGSSVHYSFCIFIELIFTSAIDSRAHTRSKRRTKKVEYSQEDELMLETTDCMTIFSYLWTFFYFISRYFAAHFSLSLSAARLNSTACLRFNLLQHTPHTIHIALQFSSVHTYPKGYNQRRIDYEVRLCPRALNSPVFKSSSNSFTFKTAGIAMQWHGIKILSVQFFRKGF